MAPMFELQRAMLTGSQRAMTEAMEFQRDMAHAMVDTVESGEAVQRGGLEMLRMMTTTYMTAMGSMGTGRSGREAADRWTRTVDEQFDSVRHNQEAMLEAMEAAMEAGADAYDEMADSYLEMYTDSVESMLGMTAAAEGEAAQVTVTPE